MPSGRTAIRVFPLACTLVVLALIGALVAPAAASEPPAGLPASPPVRPAGPVAEPAPAPAPPRALDPLAGPASEVHAGKADKRVPLPLDARPVPTVGTAARPAAVTASATAADTTPPGPPGAIVATAGGLASITASWGAAQDGESGIAYYAVAIGTQPSGVYATLGDVRWWQLVAGTTATFAVALDPAKTYYVSVYAINGAGASGAIVTSGPVRGAWRDLGAATNTVRVAFASSGYDANGNATAGFAPALVTQMTAFASRMVPILVNRYGPPADDYTVTVVRDLRYTSSNIFLPESDEIRMNDSFSPQLFTHELIHAFRNDHLVSSNASWQYDATLSAFEEGFAQAVSYEAMNDYVAAYPNDTIVSGTSLWDSSLEWDYDFQNVPELRGTDFWSDNGSTGMHWTRYEMAAAAIRKISIESADFAKRFNAAYYARINAAPTTFRPTRASVIEIIASLVPTIEGLPAAVWIDRQHILAATNVYGEKIYHRVQDYPTATELYAFHDLAFVETMSCGSEWACWDGTQWVYHRLNGSAGTARVLDASGATVWSGPLLVEPTQNPADGWFGVGKDTKGLTTATSLAPWPGGSTADWVLGLRANGLYRFESTFVDARTGASTTNSIVRVLGSSVAGFKGVMGGVLGRRTGTVTLTHDRVAGTVTLPVVEGAFAGATPWTGIPNTRTGGIDSVPGKVTITFVDGVSGATSTFRRNVAWGSSKGTQMFLLDPGASPDATPPATTVTAPVAGATVWGDVTLIASAADDRGVAQVRLSVDGATVCTLAATPYACSWSSTSVADGAHLVRAVATDAAGNSTTSAAVSVVVANAAPSISLTAPAMGATVTGTVAVSASVTSTSGTARVDFYRDAGVLLGSSSASAPTISWDTSSLAAGSTHTLYAIATAPNGNRTTSASRTVTVRDAVAPTVAVTSPTAGATISGTVTVTAHASDDVGVAKVELLLDGAVFATLTASPYRASLPTASRALGTHTIAARATDAAGNASTSAAVTVTIVDGSAPSVSITSPRAGSTVARGSTVTITASASDDRAVARVEISVNNVLRCTDTAAPYTCAWTVPPTRGVRYTIRARAVDTSGRMTDSTIAVTS